MGIRKTVFVLTVLAELVVIGSLSGILDTSMISGGFGEDVNTVCGDLELEEGEVAVNYSSLKPDRHRFREYSHGLREENFSVEKPEEVYRILVLGDSYTYGNGIEESERYSNVLERKLNSRYSREIEVINAGYPGTGMKDYYLFLKNRGVEFEPDLVVVGFSYWDGVSYTRRKMMQEDVMEEYGGEGETDYWDNEEAKQALESRVVEYLVANKGNQSDIWVYGRMIEKLSREKGFENVLYETISWPGSSSMPERLEECGVDVLRKPEELGLNDKYTLEGDLHYNPEGNRLLGSKLHNYLVETGRIEK